MGCNMFKINFPVWRDLCIDFPKIIGPWPQVQMSRKIPEHVVVAPFNIPVWGVV